MRIKPLLQTLQKSGSLCLTPPPPQFSLCTHSLLPSLTKRRRKTRKFNNAFERQDYLRRRLRCYAASEISCALLSFCSHHIPSSFHSSLPFYSPSWLKTALKKHIKTLLWCHGRQLTPGVQNYRLPGMWHIFGRVGWQVCMADFSGRVGIGKGGCVICLFVCLKEGYFSNEVMLWQIWDNPFLSVWKVK